MPSYPYYTEPTHDRGTYTNDSDNAARDTTISNAEGRLIVDAVDKVFLLEPNKHPLVTLLNQVRASDGVYKGSRIMKNTTGNPEFKWFEDVYGGRYAKVATAESNTSEQTMVVSGAGANSAYIFTKGDVVKNARTGENVIVDSITNGTTMEVTRSVGATVATATNAQDGLFIVGNASEENAVARNVNTTRSVAQSNYTQIFKTSIALSGTEDAAKLYGGRDLPYLRSKKATEHALDIERAFWWGEKGTDTGGTQGHARRFTGGVQEFIEAGNSYIQNQGGALTAPDLNTFLREGFTYGNSTKMLFAGGLLLQAINEIARGQIQTSVGDTTYGIKISNWMTAFGEVKICHNPLFVEDYAGYGFLLDMESFKYRCMEGRDTKLMTNIQAPDVDGIVDQYLTECGLQRMQAPRHAILKGVTA